MSGFLFALVAALLAGFGARDQTIVAGIAARHGGRVAVLLVALCSTVVAAGGAVWLAAAFAPQLTPPAQTMLAVLALGLAALDLLLSRRPKPPKEPTHSLGAFGIVLLAQQLTDASRFLLFAIAVASVMPLAAGLGGALGGMAVVTLGWLGADDLLRLPLAAVRRWLGAALLLVSIGLFFALR